MQCLNYSLIEPSKHCFLLNCDFQWILRIVRYQMSVKIVYERIMTLIVLSAHPTIFPQNWYKYILDCCCHGLFCDHQTILQTAKFEKSFRSAHGISLCSVNSSLRDWRGPTFSTIGCSFWHGLKFYLQYLIHIMTDIVI